MELPLEQLGFPNKKNISVIIVSAWLRTQNLIVWELGKKHKFLTKAAHMKNLNKNLTSYLSYYSHNEDGSASAFYKWDDQCHQDQCAIAETILSTNNIEQHQGTSDRPNVRFGRTVRPNFYCAVRPKWQNFFLQNTELFFYITFNANGILSYFCFA